MDVYNRLAKYPVFTIGEVEKLTGNSKTVYSQLDRLMKKAWLKRFEGISILPSIRIIIRNYIQMKYSS